MKIFLKIIYVLLTTFLTAITTANLTAMLNEYGSGWDGIAGFLGALMIGTLLGLVGGIYSLKWIKDEKLGTSILIVIGLTALMFLFIYLRVDARKVKSMRIERSAKYPNHIGLYKVAFERDLVLHFQSVIYTNGELSTTDFDRLVINENGNNFSF